MVFHNKFSQSGNWEKTNINKKKKIDLSRKLYNIYIIEIFFEIGNKITNTVIMITFFYKCIVVKYAIILNFAQNRLLNAMI